jgi:hypothetical protein
MQGHTALLDRGFGPDKPVMKTTQISKRNAMIDLISVSEPITGS